MERRLVLTQLMIPELFTELGTVLYIGANVDRFDLGPQLYKAGHEITVVEIWQPFIDDIEQHEIRKLMAHLVKGDVRKIDELALPHVAFDWTVWNHGPEHVKEHELKPTVEKLEALTKRAVVLGCPWGKYPQGPVYGNPYEIHESVLYPGHFRAMGYNVACLEPKDKPGGHILAWKWKNGIRHRPVPQ